MPSRTLFSFLQKGFLNFQAVRIRVTKKKQENILDDILQKGKCNQKIPEANKILKMFHEADTMFNFTFYFTKNAECRNFKKVGLICPMPFRLGLTIF
jgi:hypothetical protein